MRRGCDKQVNTSQKNKVSENQKCGKNRPMVPPLDHFQGKNENHSFLARTISASRRSFFVNLTTFERRSGLKKLKKVIGPEEMPILVLGRRKRPQLKWDRPKT